jgi:hypothetical protein
MKLRNGHALAPVCGRPPQMKSPAWGRGAYPNGAGGYWGARRRGVNAISHRECARPIIRWCAVFRSAGGLLLSRHTAGRLTNVGNQAESKPFTFIFGVGIPNIGSKDSAAGRLKGATAEGRTVPECGPSIPFGPRRTRRAGHADAVLATNDFRERLVGDERVSAAPSKQRPGSRLTQG